MSVIPDKYSNICFTIDKIKFKFYLFHVIKKLYKDMPKPLLVLATNTEYLLSLI